MDTKTLAEIAQVTIHVTREALADEVVATGESYLSLCEKVLAGIDDVEELDRVGKILSDRPDGDMLLAAGAAALTAMYPDGSERAEWHVTRQRGILAQQIERAVVRAVPSSIRTRLRYTDEEQVIRGEIEEKRVAFRASLTARVEALLGGAL